MSLASGARRILVKSGDRIVRYGPEQPITDGEIRSSLVHPRDGRLNVPVLVLGDLLVRGYTRALYEEVFGDRVVS